MTRRRKIILGSAAVVVLALVAGAVARKKRAAVIEVQVGKVGRQDLAAVVTASGEIRPRHFVNIGSQAFGKILAIEVSEGDVVRQGQVLLRMEAVQPEAEVEGQRALVQSGEAEVQAAEANQRTAEAELARARADFERAQLEWERAQQLFRGGLIPQSENDLRKSSFESAQASVDLAAARVRQAAAEQDRSRSQLQQARAGLQRLQDVLQKTVYTSPIDGVVTSLPVHVGEQMVPGIQNSPGSFLMTVADMSEVTAEVRVDESDVVEVRPGQPAEVTIDAYPDSVYRGSVAEIGTTAILRSTGQSSTQLTTGSQEAKDFKVVVTLTKPPARVRPGLSATARITTATRTKALNIPLQALAIRRKPDIEAAEEAASKGWAEKEGAEKQKSGREKAAEDKVAAGAGDAGKATPAVSAATDTPTANPPGKQELQGVFVVQDGRAHFRPVKTGITGVTDIEVTDGLTEGESIVTGSYKVLRELKHLTAVRPEKAEAKKATP